MTDLKKYEKELAFLEGEVMPFDPFRRETVIQGSPDDCFAENKVFENDLLLFFP